MHYTTISVKFRELTESEARLGNLRPLSSDVIARLVEKHDVIADNLNTRVLSLQARATMIYWTILLTLAVGVLLVIFAGYLSSFDTESNMLWLRLDNEFSRAYAGGSSAGGSSDAIQRYSKHYDDVLNAPLQIWLQGTARVEYGTGHRLS